MRSLDTIRQPSLLFRSTGIPPVSGQGGTGILPVSPAPLAPPSLSQVNKVCPGIAGVPAGLLQSSTARLHRAAHPFPSQVAARSPLLVALLPSGAGRGPPGPGHLVARRCDTLFSAPAGQPNLTLRLKAQAPTARGGCFSPSCRKRPFELPVPLSRALRRHTDTFPSITAVYR